MKSIYLVFSLTPYKMATVIRRVTGEKYNHVSVSFDENLKEVYSFCRHHRNTPLYGGLELEKSCRFFNNGGVSSVAIAKLDISDEDYERVHAIANEMFRHKNDYIYNMFSAAMYPFKRRVLIKDSYTCVEFSYYLLSLFDDTVNPHKYYSITDLYNKYGDKLIYEGVFDFEFISDASFEEKISLPKRWKLTIGTITDLVRAAGR